MIKKTVCVVLDTNTWRRNLLLRTGLGSAFLYTVNSGGFSIGLPEVIEDEVVKHTEKAAKEARAKIERNFRDLQAVMGAHRPYELPTDKEVSEAVVSRFASLEQLIVRTPFTLEHAKSALNRVNQSLPPSSTKNQQFKDSAIWEAALDLAKSYDLFLVTNDGDFFHSKEKKILDITLQEEVKVAGVNIKVFSDLESCLSELEQQRPDQDLKVVAEKIFESIEGEVSSTVAANNLKPIGLSAYDVRPFITEDHNSLAIEYSISLDAVNTETNELNDGESATINVQGSCVFNIRAGFIEQNRYSTIGQNWVGTDGVHKVSKGAYLHSGTAYLGRGPNVPYTTRQEIYMGNN